MNTGKSIKVSPQTRPEKIDALLNLLEDEDKQVSSLAMEQLLAMGHGANELVREFQESPNPVLRSRIHQLNNLLAVRRRRLSLMKRARTGQLGLWEGLVMITQQYAPHVNADKIHEDYGRLQDAAGPVVNAMSLAAAMRQSEYGMVVEHYLASDLFLLDQVFENRVGSAVILCCMAKSLADDCNLPVSVILYRGRHCLIDKKRNLIEPSESWRVTQLPAEEKLCHCSKWNLWLAVLSQLFLATLQEGQIQAVYRIASILAGFCGGSLKDLPYPIGDETTGVER